MKDILSIQSAPNPHWVGDGFHVRSLFSYQGDTSSVSPFLLLDYAAPRHFAAATQPRGVGVHPHRGFETVTIVYQGEVEHRDSSGGGGVIGAGDVQWMTAASGILHDEFHSKAFTQNGGQMEMVQLWVNLPAKDKMASPRYQHLRRQDIPTVDLPSGAGTLRVIAGEYRGNRGPAATFTPLDVWDLRLARGRRQEFQIDEDRTLALVVLRGEILVNGTHTARESQLVTLSRRGREVLIEATQDASILLLSGEPIEEPVVGYGPFVMNTEGEIRQAIQDFNAGKFGAGLQSAATAESLG